MPKIIARIQNRSRLLTASLTTAAVVAASTAGAQTAQTTLITGDQMTGLKTDWVGAATVGVPALLGMFAIKLGADFLIRRASRMGK